MWDLLRLFLKKKKSSREKLQTFTYFIPAPPSRKSGYREKEFDKICFTIFKQGLQVHSIHTQSLSSAGACGMWVVFLVSGNEEITDQLDLEFSSPNANIAMEMQQDEADDTLDKKKYFGDDFISDLDMADLGPFQQPISNSKTK